MGELAIVNRVIAEELIAAGFEVVGVKKGRYGYIYYFADGEEIRATVEKFLENF